MLSLHRRVSSFRSSYWTVANVLQVPRQPNNFDCGVCVILFAYAASRQRQVETNDFTLAALSWFRQSLAAEMVLPTGTKMPEWVFQRGEELLAHRSGYYAAHDLAGDVVSTAKRTLGNMLDALFVTCMAGRVTAGTIALWTDELWTYETKSEVAEAALDEAIRQFGRYPIMADALLQEAQELYEQLVQAEQ